VGKRLKSWVEIAGFVSCGVRTAQRYERELGLPVHRDRDRRAVWADGDELLNWVRGFKLSDRLRPRSQAASAQAGSKRQRE